MRWLRKLLRRPAPDDRWWEDGWPVVVLPVTGRFTAMMMTEFCAAEWDITLDAHMQLFGEGPPKELRGLRDFV